MGGKARAKVKGAGSQGSVVDALLQGRRHAKVLAGRAPLLPATRLAVVALPEDRRSHCLGAGP